MRIVSLLPSATETLFALGFDEEIVGVSHECDFPAASEDEDVRGALAPTRRTRLRLRRTGLVRQHVERGESIYAVDRDTARIARA